MLQDLLQGFKELIFPDNCFLCKEYLNSRHTKELCPSCLSTIKLNHPPFCFKCSRHLDIFNPQGLCAGCLKTQPSLDAAYSACLYEEPLTDLLHAFKYHGKTSLKNTFVQLMIEFIDTYHIPLKDYDIILPIPLHPARFRERGFNQAEILSSKIAQHYQLNHQTNILKRSKFTKAQALLEAKQRFTNLDGAFRIDSSFKIADKNVLIVDDLLTTAATGNAASLALKGAGAAQVALLTLSITP